MRYRCPVCLFNKLPYPAADYHICPCCGTEFGNDDEQFSSSQLREMWVGTGAHWFFGNPPPHWNPWMQLILGGQAASVPFTTPLKLEADTKIGPTLILKESYPTLLAA